MSAKVMGAVMTCGPKKVAVRFVLVAIADNADDYGFACLSIETIADKACCSTRTAVRLVDALEREGWMSVRRHVFGGRGSVYYLNIEKLGVSVSEKSTKSRMHLEVARMLDEKSPRAKLSLGNQAAAVEPATPPRDNSQGVQVTKTTIPRDKNDVAILKNHCEPLKNQSTPLPPMRGERASCSPEFDESARPPWERSACDAVQHVRRECDWSDRRLDPVIEQALRDRCQKTGAANLLVCAGTMVTGWREYLKHKHLLRFHVGERKFITRGWWLDDRAWPWDEQRLQQNRRL